ncbi:MAG: hypothetical protein Q7S68_00435 [Deltaproteobacteria bacterium]|nr:hypothetical protein [Deltaproteobacteria bacterium]
MKLAFFAGWWVVSSILLFLVWNKVVAALTNVKTGKFWQALLVVLTIAVLCIAPKMVMKKGGAFKCKAHAGCHQGSEDHKKFCPYEKSALPQEEEVSSPVETETPE